MFSLRIVLFIVGITIIALDLICFITGITQVLVFLFGLIGAVPIFLIFTNDSVMQFLGISDDLICSIAFGALATLYKLDNYMVKKILDHKYQDSPKDVYTHTLINKLYEEINKINL